jgi:hypothetical protein
MRRRLAMLLLGALFQAAPAHAAPASAPAMRPKVELPAAKSPAVPRVPVNFVRIDAGSALLVRSKNARDPGVWCQKPCTLPLVPGRYHLRLIEADGLVSTAALSIGESQNIRLSAPNRGMRNFGLDLVAGGFALTAVTGAITTLALIDSNIPRPLLDTSLVGMGIGVALGAVGLAIWLPNMHPDVEVERYTRVESGRTRERLHLAERPSTAGLMLRGTF